MQTDFLTVLEECMHEHALVGILTSSLSGYHFTVSRINCIMSDPKDSRETTIKLDEPDFIGNALKENPIRLKNIIEVKKYKGLKGLPF